MKKEWLKKYPLVDINKTDMMYYTKYPNPNPLSGPIAASTVVLNTLNDAASTAYNALDNLGNFVAETLTGQAQASAAPSPEALASSETKGGQLEEMPLSILSVVEEEKEEGEEKPEESNKKVITI